MNRTTRQPDLPLDRQSDDTALGRALFDWLLPGYLLLILLGFVVFRSSAAMVYGNEMSVDRALFTAINAATLTGFEQAVPTGDYRPIGQVAILLLTIGGTLFSLIGGGLAAVRLLRLSYSHRQVVRAAIIAQAAVLAVGALPLLLSPQQSAFAAVVQAASAFANSGLYVGALPGVLAWQTHLVLLPLAVVGGLGLPVLMELTDALRLRRPLSLHSRSVLGMTAGLYLLGLMLCLGLQATALDGWETGRSIAAGSSVAAINSRTLGMPLQPVYRWAPAMQWAMLLFMAIGASPAGTGGGLKTTTLVELVRGVRRVLRGERAGRSFGLAVTWVGGYLLIIFVAMLAMLWANPQTRISADRLLFVVTSAASNVGLSHDPISFTGPELYTLSAVALAGRLAPVLLLYWAARTTRDADLAVA